MRRLAAEDLKGGGAIHLAAFQVEGLLVAFAEKRFEARLAKNGFVVERGQVDAPTPQAPPFEQVAREEAEMSFDLARGQAGRITAASLGPGGGQTNEEGERSFPRLHVLNLLRRPPGHRLGEGRAGMKAMLSSEKMVVKVWISDAVIL